MRMRINNAISRIAISFVTVVFVIAAIGSGIYISSQITTSSFTTSNPASQAPTTTLNDTYTSSGTLATCGTTGCPHTIITESTATTSLVTTTTIATYTYSQPAIVWDVVSNSTTSTWTVSPTIEITASCSGFDYSTTISNSNATIIESVYCYSFTITNLDNGTVTYTTTQT
jgi:hypothetical protein